MANGERGSFKMFRERSAKGIGEQSLETLGELLDRGGYQIEEWWQLGQPPRVDDLVGRVRVDRDQLAGAVTDLLSLDDIPLDILIKGQPPRLREVQIEFRTPGMR